VPTPPTERRQGGFIAEGYDADLDELRAAAGNSRRAIAALEARYRDETGVAALKIRHNGVLGYFIEVPARHADRLMAPDSGFTHRQTMAGAVRFNALALHEEASRIAEAGGHALAAEEAHFEDLIARAAPRARDCRHRRRARPHRRGRQPCRARGEGGWCLPQVVEEPVLAIEGGRHPVVEAALAKAGERFVANDCTWARPTAVAGGRPQHGRQIDLPAPERADRAAGAGGPMCPRKAPRWAWSIACSAASAPATTWRAGARPSWSKWSRPPRSCSRPGAQLRDPRRSGARHLHLRWPRAGLGRGRGGA
jgi:hypothetical protein